MFMQKIEIATSAARSMPRALKLTVGLLFTLICMAIMVPWTAIVFLWLGVVVIGKAMARGASMIHDTLLFAGETVLGR